jgi:hypothetical protein
MTKHNDKIYFTKLKFMAKYRSASLNKNITICVASALSSDIKFI